MNFFTAVRSLTSSAHRTLLQAAGQPSHESEPSQDWQQRDTERSSLNGEDDSPPLLVPYLPGQERRPSRASQPEDGAGSSEMSADPVLQACKNSARLSVASREAFSGTRVVRCGGVSKRESPLPKQSFPKAAGEFSPEGSTPEREASSDSFVKRISGAFSGSVTDTADSGASSSATSSVLFDAGPSSSSMFGSMVVNFATAAAQSLIESIEQSSQQLFRPPGMYKVSKNIWIIDYPDPEAPNTGFLVAYLEHHHANKYLILNMSERQYQRVSCPPSASTARSTSASPEERDCLQPPSDSLFPSGTVVDVAYRGLPYPPLSLTLSLLLSVHKWLESDAENVLLVHCVEGFSRSITFVAAYLHWTGFSPTLQDAVRFLEDVCGVDATDPLVLLPSQKRFLRFFQHVCVKQTLLPSLEAKKLRRIILNGVPAFLEARSDPGAPHQPGKPLNPESEEGQGRALFRPVLEVWNQGALAFSSLSACIPQNGVNAKQAAGADQTGAKLVSSCDEWCVPDEIACRLPVYTESEESIRFDIPGVKLWGDVLLRLIHVAVQPVRDSDRDESECEAAGNQQADIPGSKEQTASTFLTVARKISTARIAFHTDMTREGGCLEIRKAGMDGAVVLPAFPEDCFMSIFFEELSPDEKENPQEMERLKEETRLLVQARKEGTAVRAGRSQSPEGHSAANGTRSHVQHPCDEDEQRRTQKRLELRQQVQEYKALAEQWHLAASRQRSSSDERVAYTPPGTDARDTALATGEAVSEETLLVYEPKDLQVFEARLTDGESNGEEDRDPVGGPDFFPDSCSAATPSGRSAETEQPGVAGAGGSHQSLVSHTCGGTLREAALRPVVATGPGEADTSIPQLHEHLKMTELGSADDLESESDVSWGNDDDEQENGEP
ncbi:hypothetical protein TGME49_232620 [Toxoplasma gondii ME49]|uniref:Tyrosine specific protein phosphatases domain-containing protein n=6 Tax=Toxoplasma gondii TaxID=5811 RepID=B6KJV8_TOXGV|nr:hypothetical protein TGME49_232620 [Toxoplasma gondii ME49]ESS35807.1 hypothetical protein TGVEG_232620 [Toxoplasma gondii VEG]KFG63821.1 hypothetical protein TGRUB_232620 [Toxoplasma gondii RUB]KFH11278.1 hypothetical protein TGVAND_232620 [Toxoplasma gondii VAND]KYF46218.1 hypothetical protein TGARI_232620 [Toxoplasma gondii ARI]RQX75749.1 hypothetical protein TGCAST_232620 [Toxoplasma gondii CAST]|eukprot:XP_002368131.1 hypothetical protein TGME49_232620 [Toxoplasma gondii ME49]